MPVPKIQGFRQASGVLRLEDSIPRKAAGFMDVSFNVNLK